MKTASDPWYVYIVECADGTLYTGCTTNIEHRLEKHNSGKGAKYTRGNGPVQLLHSEECRDKSAAQKREHEIKQLTRSAKLELISSYSQLV